MNFKKKLISVVSTAYNEEKIEKSIASWHKWLSNNRISYEIIVYDDGSKDKTYKILKNLKNIPS